MDPSVRQNGVFETVDGHDPLALGLIAVVTLIVGAAGACAPAPPRRRDQSRGGAAVRVDVVANGSRLRPTDRLVSR